MASADDLLYGSSNNELTDYQRKWLNNYIQVWDVVEYQEAINHG